MYYYIFVLLIGRAEMITIKNLFTNKAFWLLAITAVISGAGWILIPSQIHIVPKEFSIAYRFVLTSFVLASIVLLKGEKLFDKRIMKLIIFQGIIMYPLTYFLSYSACAHIPSCLVGLISSMIVVPTYMVGLIAREYKFSISTTAIVISSCIGLSLVFHQDITMINNSIFGIILAISSAVTSALGYALIRTVSIKTNLSTIAIAALSTGTGGISSLCYSLAIHREFQFSIEQNYIVSLLILGVVLTPFVFVSLYHLAAKFSTLHTSYVFALAPIFSIAMSYVFEDYRPDLWNLIGVVVVIFTCLLAQKKVEELKNMRDIDG